MNRGDINKIDIFYLDAFDSFYRDLFHTSIMNRLNRFILPFGNNDIVVSLCEWERYQGDIWKKKRELTIKLSKLGNSINEL